MSRKQPSPAPGTPGYRGPRQFRPNPPPPPPRKRSDPITVSFQHDEPVLRYEAHIDIPPPPPPSEDKDTGVHIRDGGGFGSGPKNPRHTLDRRTDAPYAGQSRYRLARKGDGYSVQVWRRPWWRFGPYGWRLVYSALWFAELTRGEAEDYLKEFRAVEARPTWQAVEEP